MKFIIGLMVWFFIFCFAFVIYIPYLVLKTFIKLTVYFLFIICGKKDKFSWNWNKNNKKKKRRNNRSNNVFDSMFDKEASLFGLSKSDKKIARSERLTPNEFVEAEERMDDELFTDEDDFYYDDLD